MQNKHRLLEDHYSREWQEQFLSPIPKHLTSEERKEWEENLAWEKQEIKRRKAEGFYPNQD